MSQFSDKSIVEYIGPGSGHSCGYCKSKDTNFSYGMWGHIMKAQDYQDLINRGWRRSGCYLYKPQLDIQCCPMYPIKCDAINFKLSHSQKKVIKAFNRYINYGIIPKSSEEHMNGDDTNCSGGGAYGNMNQSGESSSNKIKHIPKPGIGADTKKPKCMKAKLLRMERKKLMKVDEDRSQVVQKKTPNAGKSLEDYLDETVENPKHKLRIKLVRSEAATEANIVASSHGVYSKYQTIIHHDEPSSVKQKQFARFLVKSPLIIDQESGDHPGYGSFHQQYWIDDDLVAVGVIDILPKCISSVYLFYDPRFNFLSLGTYTALSEIAFVRRLNLIDEHLSNYYMGFYIHSCPKMKYKGNFRPSSLLCPETFTWHPIEKCQPILDSRKYSRFAESDIDDEDGKGVKVKDISIMSQGRILKYSEYHRRMFGGSDPENSSKEIREYAQLVGKNCCGGMLLVG